MTFPRTLRPRPARRGVTLVEMLVAVALLVLMMTVIVQVFAAATGAMLTSRTYQELDNSLRQLDATLRQDLQNITARLTPPLDPKNNLGYFEYGENSFADLQGEDTDDYVRFTVKAPEGQLFTGRVFFPVYGNLPGGSAAYVQRYAIDSQPITITSQYAEVIYFLRNGNLYRRVLLVAPERQSSVTQYLAAAPAAFVAGVFNPALPAVIQSSWQGLNDLSAHPSPIGPTGTAILNSLGDLTNRENRWAYQRYTSDFFDTGGALNPDGLPDDANSDSVYDFWPSLYWNARAAGLTNEPGTANPQANLPLPQEQMAFPYVFPGAYSVPDQKSAAVGWIHTPDPGIDQTTLGLPAQKNNNGLNQLNHAPLDLGDSLPHSGTKSTWWGFPTWRETMYPFAWNDPYTSPNSGGQPNGLHYFNPTTNPATTSANFLPPLPPTLTYIPGTATLIRSLPLLYSDNAGSSSPFITMPAPLPADGLWRQTWEDDLIMTGVRSFDVKAYDNAYPGYVDLGWGDDLRIVTPASGGTVTTPPFLADNSTAVKAGTGFPLVLSWGGSTTSLINQSYAHEGRIPPLFKDYRLDWQSTERLPDGKRLHESSQYLSNASGLAPSGGGFNIGDNTASVVRLRRVWDSWSTDYSYAPATGFNPANGSPWPLTSTTSNPTMPVYPSYPPPYPMPLRGIQIQIRVVDPKSERVKVLTIRQDFSDKL
jgi:prepilin-type N-terminal cleavage/methylation domain-containing protein